MPLTSLCNYNDRNCLDTHLPTVLGVPSDLIIIASGRDQLPYVGLLCASHVPWNQASVVF